MCKLFLFGTPAIECSSRSQPIQRRKARALLAYLAVTRQSHSREALAAMLWPEYDRQNALADLSRILSNLRKLLGDTFFLTDRESLGAGPRNPGRSSGAGSVSSAGAFTGRRGGDLVCSPSS